MENKEKLSRYLKELPIEKPSDNFTLLVMNRVRLEPVKASVVYQPLISRQIWWGVFIGFLLLVLATLLLYVFVPADHSPDKLSSLINIDFSMILKPLGLLTQALSKLSFNYMVIITAISFLLFFDQLYTRYTDR